MALLVAFAPSYLGTGIWIRRKRDSTAFKWKLMWDRRNPQKNLQKMDSIQLDGRFGGITKVFRKWILCNQP